MNIADIFATVRLDIDTGKFEEQATKAADKVATSMGTRMKVAAGAVGGVLGMAAGAALASATRGAIEMDAAMAKLTAETGMTADEAERAQAALSGMFRTNLQSYDQIADAMAKVHNDLGLVGAEADAATESFLKFATATGQEAAGAVVAMGDVLDAWNLTAADTQGLMDGLIADHQKFGGVVGESMAALKSMAPAMQAAGMSIDDARALLNLFNDSGIDAGRAIQGISSAIAKLKPGQDLNDLLAQIGAIADPTLRAQEAMKVFGSEAGAVIANLKGDLSDYVLEADEVAGATERAADAIEGALGNRATTALKGLNGALADFGTQLGDLLLVAALVGPKVGTMLFAGLGGAFGLLTTTLGPKLAEGLASLWLTVGGSNVVMGAAATAGEKSALAYLGGWKGAIGLAALSKVVIDAIPAELERAGRARMGDEAYDAKVAEMEARGRTDGERVAQTFVDGYTSVLAPGVTAAAEDAGAEGPQAFARASGSYLAVAAEAGGLTVEEWAAGANAASDTIVTTGRQLMAAFHKPLDLARLRTKLAGALHSKALVSGLNSGNPAVAGAAHDQAIAILAYMDALKGPAYIAGRNAALKLAEGMRTALANAARTDTSGFLGNILPRFGGAIAKIESIYPSYESQVAALKPSAGTIQGNKDLDEVIKMLGGDVETAGKKAESAGKKMESAADKAKAKAKELADAYKEKLGAAIDAAKEKARKFFDDLHDANVKAIQDTRDLANAQLDAQIGAINAEVQAARDALEAQRDARRLEELQAAVANAETDEQRAAAQVALDDWLADQRIQQMERDAKVKVDALEIQKKANDELAAAQIAAEEERYKTQVAAFDKELAALEAYLAKHPVAWKATNDQIIALLNGYGVAFEAAGASIGAAFASGLAAGLAGAATPGTTPLYAAPSAVAGSAAVGGPVTTSVNSGVNVGTINISGASGDPKGMVREFMAELQRERLRQGMSYG